MIQLNIHTDEIHLIQITDTHLLAKMDDDFVGIKPEQHFLDILQEIQQRCSQIDAIFHTGDIVQDANIEVYQRYLQAMQPLNIPFFQTLGNHDNFELFIDNEPQCPSIHPSVIDLGQWQLIMLNSAVAGRIDGRISDVQLSDLHQHLSQVNKPTILAFHHHPFAMQSEWLDYHQLKNTEQLLEVLADFPQVKACFMGHVHQDFHCQWQGIDFYHTPATSVQFKPHSTEFSLDDTPPAFRHIVLKADGSFETYLHYLAEYQRIDMNCKGY